MNRNSRLATVLAGSAAALALGTAVAQAQDFDLSGTEVTIGTAQAQVLNIGTLKMIEMLEGWGADVTRVELPSISGLEAIIADRVEIASRSSDEILLGQSQGPRMGSFIALYGLDESKVLIRRALAGEDLSPA